MRTGSVREGIYLARLIAVCGKICAGKTYYANQLRKNEQAVILSCDELTKCLFDNDLGDSHDAMLCRIRDFLRQKSAEIVKAGCTVILDWGFWRRADRKSLTAFCAMQGIPCEWHYIDVDDRTWHKNIAARNSRILSGAGGSDYYLDEGLMRKLLALWEAPSEDEIDVRYLLKR